MFHVINTCINIFNFLWKLDIQINMASSLKQNNLHLDLTVNKCIRQNHKHVFNIQDDVIYVCYACNISACYACMLDISALYLVINIPVFIFALYKAINVFEFHKLLVP